MDANDVGAESLSPDDRGLQYGDGLFETIAARNGACLNLERHLARLGRGARRLGFPDIDASLLAARCVATAEASQNGVIKVIVTRGVGGRGYRPPASPELSILVRRYPWPGLPAEAPELGITAGVLQTRLGDCPLLAGIKHLNRLEQVLASRELDTTDWDEGLMCNNSDMVIEGTRSNVFAVFGQRLVTPSLDRCGVSGVMRELVLESAAESGLRANVQSLPVAQLAEADEAFLTNSIIGIWPIREFVFGRSGQPEARRYPVARASQALRNLLRQKQQLP